MGRARVEVSEPGDGAWMRAGIEDRGLARVVEFNGSLTICQLISGAVAWDCMTDLGNLRIQQLGKTGIVHHVLEVVVGAGL
jgi:hypothetical protein